MSEFKEIIQKYAGVINEENETYSGRAIKFSDAINRLVNLGIPREKAVIAVKQAVADKSKINQIADRICCECVDEIYESDGATKNNKIKKAIAGILMAAALGATAGGIRNTMKTSYKNGLEYKEQMNKNYPAYYTDVIPGEPWYNSSPNYANGKQRMEALSQQKNRNQHDTDMAEKAAAREGYHNSVARIKIDDLDYEQYDKLYNKVLGKFNSDLSDELYDGGDGSKSVKEYISNMKKILDDESFKLLEVKRSINNDARIKSRDEKDKYFKEAKRCEDQIEEIERELKPLQYKLKKIEQNEKNNFGNKIIGIRSLKKYAYNKGKNE